MLCTKKQEKVYNNYAWGGAYDQTIRLLQVLQNLTLKNISISMLMRTEQMYGELGVLTNTSHFKKLITIQQQANSTAILLR